MRHLNNYKKFLIPLLFCVILSLPLNAFSQKRGLGLGVIVGEPTGISLKYWMKDGNAIDGAIAWSLEGNDKIHLHADYLFHEYSAVQVDKGSLPLYYGVGMRVLVKEGRNSDDQIGVRIPVGLSYLFADSPLEFFTELVPILDLSPDTELDFNGGIGLRFYFGYKRKSNQ